MKRAHGTILPNLRKKCSRELEIWIHFEYHKKWLLALMCIEC